MSLWKEVQSAPPDAILGLTEAFNSDPNPDKVNLGVGVFKDENGATPVLNAVRQAEERLVRNSRTKNYLPIAGDAAYIRCVQELLFGAEHEVLRSGRACTAHTPGGTGALRLGAEILKEFRSNGTVWVSNPTWANHKGIFSAAGLKIAEYPYYDLPARELDFAAMTAALAQVPAGDIVLLHVCCHNPTGVDLNAEQWSIVAALAAEKGWLPFLDFAYQGFGAGLEEDRAAVLQLAERGVDFFTAGSFSKNFGLYCERVGSLTVTAPDAAAMKTGFSHLKKTARVIYSNPSAHGGAIVTTIWNDPELKAQWRGELDHMRGHILQVRHALADGLAARGVPMDFSFITGQQGMFSFSGLSDAQVQFLREKKSIYIVKGGRINVAGLNAGNLDYVCDAVAESFNAG